MGNHPQVFQRGRRSGVVGRSSFRNRGGNPAADEAEAAIDAGRLTPGREAFTARHAAARDEGPRNGAPIGGPQGRGIPNLYKDPAPRSPHGCVGKYWRENASIPVTLAPMISAWMSCVPS